MNFGKMMKDLQKMQAKLQDEIDVLEIEATAGGGMVTVRMNGKKEVLALRVEPEAITPEDPEMLQDLIVAAINEAGRKVDAEVQRITQGMAGGLKIPGMF
jgi:DNA-binding YbaB/EbfC family protein